MGDPKPLTAYQQSYHWRNKNCGPWAHKWVKDTLPGVGIEGPEGSAKIKEVTSVSGDCDLGQRKGKLLTIYDIEIEATWEGTDAEGNEVKGGLSVPEFSHEAIDGLSEYVYNWSLSSSSSGPADALYSAVKSQLSSQLTAKFNGFREELLNAHGIFAAEMEGVSPSPSGSSTPAPPSGSYAPAPPTKAAAPEKPKEVEQKKVSGTSTVEVNAVLHASADDLWDILTNEKRIPMWSRSSAKMSLDVGAPFELFNNNVRGEIAMVEKPKKLVQSWQVKKLEWPSDHYGTMTITFDQGSDSTTVTFKLDGVPKGQESNIETALNQFYIRGLKEMGLVLSHSSRSYPTPRTPRTPRPRKPRPPSLLWQAVSSPQLLGAAALLGLSAVMIGLVVSSFSSPSPSPSPSPSSTGT